MARKTRVVVAFEAWLASSQAPGAKERSTARKMVQRFYIIASKAEVEAFKQLVAEAEAKAGKAKG